MCIYIFQLVRNPECRQPEDKVLSLILALVFHCTKLFQWSMAYNQYKFTAWLVIPGKLNKMLINTIE